LLLLAKYLPLLLQNKGLQHLNLLLIRPGHNLTSHKGPRPHTNQQQNKSRPHHILLTPHLPAVHRLMHRMMYPILRLMLQPLTLHMVRMLIMEMRDRRTQRSRTNTWLMLINRWSAGRRMPPGL